MDKNEVEKAIEARMSERKKKVLNRNAIGALFGAFSDPVGALGQYSSDAVTQSIMRSSVSLKM